MVSFVADVSADLETGFQTKPWLVARTLAVREIVRFFRQRNRVIGAVGQPILFWFLFSAGMNRWFQVGGESFSQYYLPGTLILILLFTAIFATISIIEDRREGFLQSVLVAPIPRWSMVLGKVLGGASVAVAQGVIFLVLAIAFGNRMSPISMLAIVLFMALAAVALTCLGFVIAWRMDSTQGFHAIMNLLLMPMWLLSGAFFPIPTIVESMSPAEMAFHWIMRINPITYAVAGVRHLMVSPGQNALVESNGGTVQYWVASMPTCWIATALFAIVMFIAACRISNRHTTGDLL